MGGGNKNIKFMKNYRMKYTKNIKKMTRISRDTWPGSW